MKMATGGFISMTSTRQCDIFLLLCEVNSIEINSGMVTVIYRNGKSRKYNSGSP